MRAVEKGEAVAWRIQYRSSKGVPCGEVILTEDAEVADMHRDRDAWIKPLYGEAASALSLSAGEAVVKPLEWLPDALTPGQYLADAGGGYQVEPRGSAYAVIGSDIYDLFNTLEEAKAAAQADYEARIRSALMTPPAAPAASDATVESEVIEYLRGKVEHAKATGAHRIDLNLYTRRVEAILAALSEPAASDASTSGIDPARLRPVVIEGFEPLLRLEEIANRDTATAVTVRTSDLKALISFAANASAMSMHMGDTIRASLATPPAPAATAMRKAMEEARFALFCSDMTIKDRADQSLRLALAALAASSVPVSASRWRHLRRGSTYSEIVRGTLQVSTRQPAEGDRLVAYRSELDGSVWFRLEAEFEDGRFEPAGSPLEPGKGTGGA